MSLTKADILNRPAPPPLRVELEGGEVVYVRRLKVAERDRFEHETRKESKTGFLNVRGRLVALTACDENGKRIFEDVDALELGRHPDSVMIDTIAEAAIRHNGMGEREIKGAEKNSDGTPAGSCDSPSLSDLAEP
jgi:hypothetical protein